MKNIKYLITLTFLIIVLYNSSNSEINTNEPIDFNSNKYEYVDNVHSQGEYSQEQARNQPFSHKIIRCFKIYFLKQLN